MILFCFPFLIHISSAFYSNSNKKILDLEQISLVNVPNDSFNTYLKSTKKARVELKKFQKLNNPQSLPLRIISPNETRWSSQFDVY